MRTIFKEKTMKFCLSTLSLAILSSLTMLQVAHAGMIQANKGDVLVEDGIIDATGSNLGVYASKGYTLTVKDDVIDIKTKYQGAKASGEGSEVIVGNHSTGTVTITASSTKRNYILDQSAVVAEKNAKATVNGKTINLISTGVSSQAVYGIYAEGGNAVVGSDVTDTINIKTQGKSTSANGGTESSGIMAYTANSSITVTAKQLNIESNGVGLFVQSNTDTEQAPENSASIRINADHTLINAADTGIRAFSNGQVNITGGVTINAPIAFDVRGNSTTAINTSHQGTVQINGDIAFETPGSAEHSGDIINANVDLYLSGSDSYWNGNAYKHYAAPVGDNKENTTVSGLKVTLANGAQWTPTIIEEHGNETGTILQGQALNNLTFENGVINVTQAQGQEVHIEKTTGSGGTVNLLTTVAEDGKLTATTVDFGDIQSETAPTIAVTYSGITADDVKSNNLGDIEGGVSAKEGSAFKESRFVQQGAIKGALTETYDENGKLLSRTIAENTRLNAYGSVAALSIMQWRHEMNDLTKRMGELRTSPEGVGSWVRIYGSEQEYGSQNITARNNSVQVGADADVGYGWKVGAAFSYTDGKADYDLGNADNKSYGLGIYGTWMADNGQFIDLIAKYSRLDTDFELEGMDGSSDNNAFSVSAEYGWHLKLGQTGFVEPQAEVTYGYIQGDKFHTSNGVEIDQDDFESLIGRVGVRSGFYLPNNKGVIYARVSGLHDFKGDFDSTATLMSDRTIFDRVSEDLGDTWVEFGVGANFNWTDTTYSYVDLERTNGGDVKENWRWNVGLRHVF